MKKNINVFILLLIILTMFCPYVAYAETITAETDGGGVSNWVPSGSSGITAQQQQVNNINTELGEFQGLLSIVNNGMIGLCLLTCILALIYQLVKLSMANGPSERSLAIKGIGTIAICLVILGGLELILRLIFYIAIS